MHYAPLDSLKNAWVFKHQSLPIADKEKAQIKPMTEARANVLWDTFISKEADHPDFFSDKDWPSNKSLWTVTENWEKRWDSDEPELPQTVLEHISWDLNTVVYFCVNRNTVIETTWKVFQMHWKNFLFMDDGTLLIGKKRKEAIQFLSNGNFKLGSKP